jgi:hypothetical protein
VGKITSKLHPARGLNAEITKLMTSSIKLKIINNFCIRVFLPRNLRNSSFYSPTKDQALVRIAKDQIDLLKEGSFETTLISRIGFKMLTGFYQCPGNLQ